jgi:dipeptidyl aminopeptidase/acylaminoacyl peptidase
MRRITLLFLASSLTVALAQVAPPESLVLDGIPPIPLELKTEAGRYLEFRAAGLSGWHPTERQILISTRFADTPQLHRVSHPGGARYQLTFLPEPVGGGTFQPRAGRYIVFSQDTGGGEFYQYYHYDPANGKATLLTDGKSRNMGGRWARSGKWLAYTSTRRNGRDNDIYLMDPADAKTDRLLHQVTGGGWSIEDWSHDETRLLLGEHLSINRSRLHVLDLKTGARQLLTPDLAQDVAYDNARFAKNDRSFFATTDRGSEFKRLVVYDLPAAGATVDAPRRVLTADLAWDVDQFELTDDGETMAYIANEAGVGVLHLMKAKTGKAIPVPTLPVGIVSGLNWHENNRELAFNISGAKSPSDVYSLDLKTGKVDRWTQSEIGGLNPAQFIEPQLIQLKSFDALPISAFVYRPDLKKFPGRRPVLISIHGGPESQSRPGFQARNNYYLNELGITLVYPNVRGSSGYGKTFLTLDNGFKREDSVRDIGAIIQWVKSDGACDAERIGVIGGSYGGYMVLASMQHYADQLRCGVDIVGISSFLTFLKNTQDYRRDLRRVEYGDERDPAMQEFLGRISPTANVNKIKRPLMIVQGKNDPRVPVTESEQMVQAIRSQGGTVWYLMAKDEGHGFAKKRNADFQFLATVAFLREYLLK